MTRSPRIAERLSEVRARIEAAARRAGRDPEDIELVAVSKRKPAEDVAAALRFLVEAAARYGYDPKRIFLAGHSSGAHLAALLALDPRYLEAVGLARSIIVGVVGISGPYDLEPEVPVSVAPGETREVETAAKWADPVLWGTPPFGEPVLYHLQSELRSGDQLVDRRYDRFGFRELWVEGNAFLYNGKPIHLMGVHASDFAHGTIGGT